MPRLLPVCASQTLHINRKGKRNAGFVMSSILLRLVKVGVERRIWLHGRGESMGQDMTAASIRSFGT
jgi:hypothetical protein